MLWSKALSILKTVVCLCLIKTASILHYSDKKNSFVLLHQMF